MLPGSLHLAETHQAGGQQGPMPWGLKADKLAFQTEKTINMGNLKEYFLKAIRITN